MTRLTFSHYQQRHQTLRELWLTRDQAYGLLPVHQQQDLHAFFSPANEMGELQLRAYRAYATAKDASLPHRAGRAYTKLMARVQCMDLDRYTDAVVTVTSGSWKLRVMGVARETIDVRQVARALIRQIEQQLGVSLDSADVTAEPLPRDPAGFAAPSTSPPPPPETPPSYPAAPPDTDARSHP